MDFDPNLFGGKIGKSLIDTNENYFLPAHKTPSPAKERSIEKQYTTGESLSTI